LTARSFLPPAGISSGLFVADVEADFTPRIRHRRGEQLSDGFQDVTDVAIVTAHSFLQFGETLSQLPVGGQDFPQLHESAHDGDVDADRALAAQHAGEHRHALLRKGEGPIPAAAVART